MVMYREWEYTAILNARRASKDRQESGKKSELRS